MGNAEIQAKELRRAASEYCEILKNAQTRLACRSEELKKARTVSCLQKIHIYMGGGRTCVLLLPEPAETPARFLLTLGFEQKSNKCTNKRRSERCKKRPLLSAEIEVKVWEGVAIWLQNDYNRQVIECCLYFFSVPGML